MLPLRATFILHPREILGAQGLPELLLCGMAPPRPQYKGIPSGLDPKSLEVSGKSPMDPAPNNPAVSVLIFLVFTLLLYFRYIGEGRRRRESSEGIQSSPSTHFAMTMASYRLRWISSDHCCQQTLAVSVRSQFFQGFITFQLTMV